MKDFVTYYVTKHPLLCSHYHATNGSLYYSLNTDRNAIGFLLGCLEEDPERKEKIQSLIIGESQMEILSALKSDILIIKTAAEYYIHLNKVHS